MIISASRRTDIPAFYSEWFMNRIKEGYVIVRNSTYHNQLYRILLSPDIVDCIVFWTKNPIPMIPRLDKLKDYCYYFQFTLTGYGKDIEAHLPDKKKDLIPAFQKLSEKIGPKRVIWRYDPIMVNDKYDIDYHVNAFGQIAESLNGYTEKCVFSFVDEYAKNANAMKTLNIRNLSVDKMNDIAKRFHDIASSNNMKLATCAEKIDLEKLGIEHNACIDKALIERLTGGAIRNTKKLTKDGGQRPECGCMLSKEIGSFNTCSNGCVYCYASYNQDSVRKSISKYDPDSPILCDSISENEQVKDAADMNSWVQYDRQLSLFDDAH